MSVWSLPCRCTRPPPVIPSNSRREASPGHRIASYWRAETPSLVLLECAPTASYPQNLLVSGGRPADALRRIIPPGPTIDLVYFSHADLGPPAPAQGPGCATAPAMVAQTPVLAASEATAAQSDSEGTGGPENLDPCCARMPTPPRIVGSLPRISLTVARAPKCISAACVPERLLNWIDRCLMSTDACDGPGDSCGLWPACPVDRTRGRTLWANENRR